jgi:glycosyltransferase involved in cell wall biosynthesis
MAVAEALACGTPVVVSRNCPWKIVEERGAGHWVENTPERVAEALLDVLTNPERARRMGEAARGVANEFGWKSITQRMIEAYERAVAERRRI